MAKRKKTQTAGHRAMVIALSILGITILVVYLVFAIYFGKHFYFRTKLGDLNAGGMTAEAAKAAIEGEAGDYLLTVYDRDGSKYHILGADIDYTYTSSGEEKQYLSSQNNLLWFLGAFQTHEYELDKSISYDAAALKNVISQLDCMKQENMATPTDAYLSKNEDGYSIVPETTGSTLKEAEVDQLIEDAVANGAAELTLTDDCYEKPAIVSTDENLNACLADINKYLQTTVTYDIGDQDEVLDASTIKDWIVIDENNLVSLDEDSVTKYVQSLATKYNTYGDTRKFTTSKGDVIEIGGGDYGWVVDKTKEKELVLADLENGTVETREPAYSQTAVSRDENDIGNTYVELDYTNQHLWYYKDGSLVMETDFVSGNINKNNGSPDGVYKIIYKKSPAVLKGENYASDVTYFMVFAYNVGIHDATWRSASQFGGSTYKTNGSHGCINVSMDAATKLYEVLAADTPVVAFYREPVTLTAENARISNAYSYKKADTN